MGRTGRGGNYFSCCKLHFVPPKLHFYKHQLLMLHGDAAISLNRGLVMYKANRGMARCFSESTYGLRTALSVSWQGIVEFCAVSDHLQRLMGSWAAEAVV